MLCHILVSFNIKSTVSVSNYLNSERPKLKGESVPNTGKWIERLQNDLQNEFATKNCVQFFSLENVV